MLKRLFLLTAIVVSWIDCAAMRDTDVVQQFGNCLSSWATNPDTSSSALETMLELCSTDPAFRIGDNIMAALASSNNLSRTETYDWDDYVTCMQKEVNKGIAISFSHIQEVPERMISKKYKDVKYVSCNIRISGASGFNEKELFILKQNKIVKITEYQVIADRHGRQRIHVNLSDLGLDEDTAGIGFTYNYSKAFPAGASIYYSKWKFMVSVDLGLNFDKDIYTTQKNEFNNLMDYKITKGEYDPKFYITATPSFYLKYFSVGWGVGGLFMKGSRHIDQWNYKVNDDGSIAVLSASGTVQEDEIKWKFMMRPNVRGFIPCNKNLFITLSASYNWIPGYNEKSGMDFGIGIQYLFN